MYIVDNMQDYLRFCILHIGLYIDLHIDLDIDLHVVLILFCILFLRIVFAY